MPISAKTEEQYARKFEQLRRQTARTIGAPLETSVAPVQIVECLIKRKPEIAKRTWRLYKAALAHQIQLARDNALDSATQQEADYALQILQSESQTGALDRGTRTSALKAKHLKPSDFDQLLKYIVANLDRHVRARALLAWCRSAAPTGLRPSEWDGAYRDTLTDGRPVLVVPNAKATAGRGNGQTRTLDLSDCSPDQLDALDELLGLIEGYRDSGGFETFRRRIAGYLYWAARAALSKRGRYPSLYTFRHQFAANAKRQFTQAEVAALMGHASDATAGRNYAQGRLASGTVSVKPVRHEVATVRSRARPSPFQSKPT